jgi:methyl halide transferase
VDSHRPPVSTPRYWEGLYAGGQDGWDLGEPTLALADWLDAGGRFEPPPARAANAKSAAGGSAGAMSGPPQLKSREEVKECPPPGESAGAMSGPPQLKSREEVKGGPPAPASAGAIAIPHIAVPGAGRGHDARLLARRGYRVTAFDFAEAAVAEARRLAAAEAVELAVERRDVFTLSHDHAGVFDGVWEYTCFCAIDPARRDEYARVLHAILRPGGLLLACFFPLREGDDGPPFPVSRADVERALAGRFTVLEAGPPPRSVERRRGLEWLVCARREPLPPPRTYAGDIGSLTDRGAA